MKILILGFDNEFDIDNFMMNWIEENQLFLFTVVCGGVPKSPIDSPTIRWSKMRGAPIIRISADNMGLLEWKLKQEVDYVIMRVTDKTPNVVKNLAMRLKDAGKHGIIIRT